MRLHVKEDVLHLVSAWTSMLSSVRFCPLPATRRRKPDWLGGVAPAEPAAGDGAVIWDVHGFAARALGPCFGAFGSNP